MPTFLDLVRPLFQRGVAHAPTSVEQVNAIDESALADDFVSAGERVVMAALIAAPENASNAEALGVLRSDRRTDRIDIRPVHSYPAEYVDADLEAARLVLQAEGTTPLVRLQALQVVVQSSERALALGAGGKANALLAERDRAITEFIDTWVATKDPSVLPEIFETLMPGPFTDDRLRAVFAAVRVAHPETLGVARLCERGILIGMQERFALTRALAYPHDTPNIALLEPLLGNPDRELAGHVGAVLSRTPIFSGWDLRLRLRCLQALTAGVNPPWRDFERVTSLTLALGDRTQAQAQAQRCVDTIVASSQRPDFSFDTTAVRDLVNFCTRNDIAITAEPLFAAAERAGMDELLDVISDFGIDDRVRTLAATMIETFDVHTPIDVLMRWGYVLADQHDAAPLMVKLFDKLDAAIAFAPQELLSSSAADDTLSRSNLADLTRQINTLRFADDERNRRLQRLADQANGLMELKRAGIHLTLAFLRSANPVWPTLNRKGEID